MGRDNKGRDIGSYSPEQYRAYLKTQEDLRALREESRRFKEARKEKELGADTEGIDDEKNRRKLIGVLQGKRMAKYEGNPEWDDVVPIPQDDGEGALAQIAYTDEYAEGKFLKSML